MSGLNQPEAGSTASRAPDFGARDAVRSGQFFGAGHRERAAKLAAFIAAPLRGSADLWFGADGAVEPDLRRALIERDIVWIDTLISAQIDAILHHPRLLHLEGSWRGLRWLIDQTDPNQRLKLKILPVSWAEICRDLERASEFDQSNLFRRVYEDEFGIAGGEPFGLLVLDYEVRHRPGPGAPQDDIAALNNLSAVAAAAFAPMVLGAAPGLFGVDQFAELSGVADPVAPFSETSFQRWRSLRTREDTRFLALALPRLRARLGWRDMVPAERGWRYHEVIESTAEMVWFNAGYAVAAMVGRSMAHYGWPADMRGYDTDRLGGGLLDYTLEGEFSTDPSRGLDRFALEIALTDRQERSLVEAGLMPLSTIHFGGDVLLGSARSIQAAKRYNSEGADANARISAQFNTIVCVSRFAHFVKVMGREMTGAFRRAEEIEDRLTQWLTRFVNSNLDVSPQVRAKYPLLAASVSVREKPGQPGVFGCTIQLQPQYQIDDISASFRLITELATPGAR